MNKELPTILIIDDDIDLVEVLRITLENAGYNVIDAQTGIRGYNLAHTLKPDLIILDVMMGTIDEGFHTAYQIRRNPELDDIPIIMLTAVTQRTGFKFNRETDESFLPVSEFIEKPVNPRKLVDTVRKHLIAAK